MKLQANGLTLEVDVQGADQAAPLLLVMGLGMQLIAWPQPLVELLVAQGFRVIRFDNRDAGLSQGFDHLKPPALVKGALRHALRRPQRALAYTLADMADDCAGVLDALGIARAHAVGASMGGMIVQHLALRHPARVRSAVLLMTSSGAPHLPKPSRALQWFGLTQGWTRRFRGQASAMAYLRRAYTLIESPGFPNRPDELAQRVQATVQRAWRPHGTTRQLLAIVADGDRSPRLAQVTAPTLVLHGNADPLIPPAAAHDLAAKITGAGIALVDGMGHDLPAALLPRLAAEIAAHARAADAAQAVAPAVAA